MPFNSHPQPRKSAFSVFSLLKRNFRSPTFPSSFAELSLGETNTTYERLQQFIRYRYQKASKKTAKRTLKWFPPFQKPNPHLNRHYSAYLPFNHLRIHHLPQITIDRTRMNDEKLKWRIPAWPFVV